MFKRDEGVELRDCRLCKKYDDDTSVEVKTFNCGAGFFNYVEDDDGCRGASPDFQCNGCGYAFNGRYELLHALKASECPEREEAVI